MDRREFIWMIGGVANPVVWRAGRTVGAQHAAPLPAPAPLPSAPLPAPGRLRFDLDDRRRWSLAWVGEGRTVPLIEHAVLGVAIGDAVVTLADLTEVVTGTREPPGGDAIVIRGRGGDVYLETEFVSGPWAEAPRGAVSVSVYPDRHLPVVRDVRFLELSGGQVLPGAGPLMALASEASAGEATRIARAPNGSGDAILTSHGAGALARGTRSLALVFDARSAGLGELRLMAGGVAAVSDWRPGRPVRPEGDTCALHLAAAPDADALAVLGAALAPDSPVDADRLAAITAPAGWASRYALSDRPTEDDVLANVERCAAHFDRRHFRFVALGPGYQRALGDWETNERFPHGHRWLTEQIHARGFRAGLWLAPFVVSARSGVPDIHPDWLLRGPDGPLARAARPLDTGRAYALDGAHPGVQEWLYTVARRAVREWGYDLLDADLLDWAIGGASHHGGATHAEAYRRGLAAIRDGLGTEAFLLAGRAPLQHAAPYVNGVRVGGDGEAGRGGAETAARAAALASPAQRARWLNDPGNLITRAPLTLDEARAWAAVTAVSGGITFLSDDLRTLPADRIALFQRTIPVAPVPGRPVGALVEEPDRGPTLVAGDLIVPIPGPWRFRTGDDARYAARDFDEEAWETIAVPQAWAAAERPQYTGYAWYRARFALPPALPSPERTLFLELGKIDDADETFVNGTRVGQTGEFPPGHRGERLTFRRYPVPTDALNWGGENILAVRVYGGDGGGGLWSGRRDRPAGTWVVEGVPRWWTVVAVNWDDEPREVALPATSLGLAAGGARFAAYDVWRDTPLAEVRDTLRATVAPRSSLVLALRPAAAHPQVVGTSRHIVQGALDIAEERWDAGTRTLSAKSVRLDGRPYLVTVAVPRGLRPGRCAADSACTVTPVPGAALLKWPAGDGRDIAWRLGFTTTTRSG